MSKSSSNKTDPRLEQPIFCPRKARKARKIYKVVALTDELALAKFLCAQVGFTQLRRRRYGAPAARRHWRCSSLSSQKTAELMECGSLLPLSKRRQAAALQSCVSSHKKSFTNRVQVSWVGQVIQVIQVSLLMA
jgi:hypothetical protein